MKPTTAVMAAAPELSTDWQELTVRLSDPVHGQAERHRLQLHLQNLQARLRAQAESGLPTAPYTQHQAARQAVDAALNILGKVSPDLSSRQAGPAAGPVQSPDFFKR
ncbi:MAG: hypothetical protein AAB176_12795 [Pseudomonadota bacterium]|jgi:hypothetical protein